MQQHNDVDAHARPCVFVTGGSGFIGAHLLRGLAAAHTPARALARTAAAQAHVAALGAEPVAGDLEDPRALEEAMRGCQTAFHLGAYLNDWDWDRAWRVNVIGTRNVVAAARAASVRRLVYVSGIGVTLGHGAVHHISEDGARGRPLGVLCATRVQSDAEAQAANGAELETIVVRLPFVWGPGDRLRPQLAAAVQRGRFSWIDGGRQAISVCHVRDAVAGLLLAAERGRPGSCYFISDDRPVALRTFISMQLALDGLRVPERSIPGWLARALADGLFHAARLLRLPGPRLFTPTTVRFLGQEITVDIGRARRELDFVPRVHFPTELSALRPLADLQSSLGEHAASAHDLPAAIPGAAP